MSVTPEQFVQTFTRLTGIKLRVMSYNQQRIAADFCKHFTLDELSSVIGYVQKQIGIGKLDERSLSFRNLFGEFGSGNEFASFQDRLACATKQIRIRPAPREVPTAVCVDGKNNVVRFAPEPEPAPDTAGALIATQLADLRKSMGGAA